MGRSPKALCRGILPKRANSPKGYEASGDGRVVGFVNSLRAAQRIRTRGAQTADKPPPQRKWVKGETLAGIGAEPQSLITQHFAKASEQPEGL